jgi:trans-2,3-dihydro-3-hydroxyanthranilate isomerase
MSWRRYTVVDVFSDVPLEGNAVAVFHDGGGLSALTMQRAARELALSETVFVLPAGRDDEVRAEVRIFTPAAELPFAGHPILGTAVVLGQDDPTSAIRLRTGAGVVAVELHRNRGEVVGAELQRPVVEAEPYEREQELLDALGVGRSELPVEAYRNGPRHVYVALGDERQVAALAPDMGALARLGPGLGFNCFAGSGTRYKTRMFAPGLGVPEDPATGSAAGPLALHLLRHGRIGFGQEIEIRQGEEIGRPALLRARVEQGAVMVAGAAVVVAQGEYRLQ